MKRPMSKALASLMASLIILAILSTTLAIASAQVQTDKVEIRGTVSQLVSTGNFSVKNWNARNFAGFWYDIDEDQQTEKLDVLGFSGNRTIEKENLKYITTRAPQKYKVFKEKGSNFTVENGLDIKLNKPSSPARGGYYALVGWMAEKYIGVNGKNNKLSKLVLEQDTTDKKTLQVGETWDLGEGYTLSAQSIDAKATPRQAWLVLSKDGTKLDDKVIAQDNVYTYSVKNLAGENDVPVFVTYVDSIFAGETSDMVQLKYTWVISTSINEVNSGDKFGIFKVDTEEPLSLKSDSSISLSRDSTISLAGNMKFKVADSDDNDVRFYPFVEISTPGKYEIRGTVSQLISKGNFDIKKWDATNFAGFWYDIDENIQSESLTALNFSGNRTIDKDNLIYSTIRAPQKYKVFKEKGSNFTVENGLDIKLNKPSSPARGGYYALVGWMAEKYIGVNGKNNKLSKLVLEQDAVDKKTLQIGETWDLGEGYTLSAQSIDAKASPRQAWLVLSKDGTKLDDKVVQQSSIYTYSIKNLAGENDVPVFVTYIDSIFAGATSDMVQLKYTWVISTSIKEVNSGDKFGIFEVNTEEPLNLKNDASISLSRDSTISLAGNMKFKVADSDDNSVRFYPKIDYEITTNVTPNQTGPSPTETNITTTITRPTNTTIAPPPTQTEAISGTPKSTETKPSPGFGAAIALIGIIAVAYIVLRQRKR